MNYLPYTTHIINTVTATSRHTIMDDNTAPAVSIEAGLELIKSIDLQVNLDDNHSNPVIFDTGASLAIPGDKQDFLPDTF